MPKQQATYLTAEGAAKIEVELQELKGPQRDALARRLRDAIQMGDLSENADYHKAKEGRIQELEQALRIATIIEATSTPKNVVAVGAQVTVQEDGSDPEVFHLVGAQEADPRSGKISHESPIGLALMDHRVGDIVEAKTPNGVIRLKILGIK
jgi:transcription elongation factor GreA